MINSIEYWHDVCMEVVRRDFSTKADGTIKPDQGGPTRTSRAMAIVHLAMHDAHFGPTAPANTYLQRLMPAVPLPPPPIPFSAASALCTAAAHCLLSMYPSHAGYINEMLNAFIDPNPDLVARDNGSGYGYAIGNTLLELRKNDGADAPMGSAPSDAYGHHRADPYAPGQGLLTPQWGNVTRFCTPARVPLDPPPGFGLPDFLTDADYRRDFKEVQDEGELNSTKRSPDERVVGYYWGYDGANEIGVPPRLYNQIARAWLDRHRPGAVDDAVRLLAMVNAGMADAGIDAWFHKYFYDVWRPVIGIRQASLSTGPQAVAGPKSSATAGADVGDPCWAPLGLPTTNEPERRALSRTPGFPAYPSGHATFGATLFQIMQRFAGGADMTLQDVLNAGNANPAVPGQDFDFVSDELDGKSIDSDGSVRTRHLRQFRNFAKPVFENAISRVYIGVHWRFDGMPRADVAGKRYGGVPLGLTIGTQTFNFFS